MRWRHVALGSLAALAPVSLWLGACSSPSPESTGSTEGLSNSNAARCPPCLTNADCNAGACAQFGGDTLCAAHCAGPRDCGPSSTCTSLSDTHGNQVNVCVPNNDVCGPTPDARKKDAGIDAKADAARDSANDVAPDVGQPDVGPPDSGQTDAGSGHIGPGGGTLSTLAFAILGDTRPASIDDTSGYPTSVIDQIYSGMGSASPALPFAVSTGDYMFATPGNGQSAPQLNLYLSARSRYGGVLFPTMGNHECTGFTASNCGPSGKDGITENYTNYLKLLLGPINQTLPYYVINVNATNGSWTAKFVFIAANAWDTTQSNWLKSTLGVSTTYTFIMRHESASANTAPGVTPSEQIMAQFPYTLAIVGHTHTYEKFSAKQIIVGNGGAPLSSSKNYGYGTVTQRSDNAVQIDMIGYQSGQPDLSFRFALHPDGTPAP